MRSYQLWQICFQKCFSGTNLQPWYIIGVFPNNSKESKSRIKKSSLCRNRLMPWEPLHIVEGLAKTNVSSKFRCMFASIRWHMPFCIRKNWRIFRNKKLEFYFCFPFIQAGVFFMLSQIGALFWSCFPKNVAKKNKQIFHKKWTLSFFVPRSESQNNPFTTESKQNRRRTCCAQQPSNN